MCKSNIISKIKEKSYFNLKIVALISILSLNIQFSKAQSLDTLRLIDPISTDIVNIIPPLSVLIDSAFNLPSIKVREADLAYKKAVITTTKRNLLKAIGFESYYSYGTSDIYSVSSINTSLNTSQLTSSRYGIGTSFRISLYDLIERKNTIKVDKIRYEQSYYEKENEKLQVRKQIITMYYDLILLQKKLKLSHQSFVDAQTQTAMAEKEFSQGELSISELANLRDMKLKSQMLVDSYWSEFMVAYTLLQEVTGIKFSNLKNIE